MRSIPRRLLALRLATATLTALSAPIRELDEQEDHEQIKILMDVLVEELDRHLDEMRAPPPPAQHSPRPDGLPF